MAGRNLYWPETERLMFVFVVSPSSGEDFTVVFR